jgi:hypothetical protein
MAVVSVKLKISHCTMAIRTLNGASQQKFNGCSVAGHIKNSFVFFATLRLCMKSACTKEKTERSKVSQAYVCPLRGQGDFAIFGFYGKT